jgi:hypothetical protein
MLLLILINVLYLVVMKNIEIFIDPEEKQQILDIIGTLARGVRGGWFQESRAAIVMCQLGTLFSDLDDLIKKLIQDFKDRVSGGEAKSFANICILSLKKVFLQSLLLLRF